MKGVFRFPVQRCPSCNSRLDAAGRATFANEPPDPGSVTICAYCFKWLTFNSDMSLRLATPQELTQTDPAEIKAAEDQVRAFQAIKKAQ